MKNHQQGFARISILILSFITLLVLAGWMYWSFNQDSVENERINEQVATSTDKTIGWKKYRNESYGYEIKYPTDFSITEHVIAKPPLHTTSVELSNSNAGCRILIDNIGRGVSPDHTFVKGNITVDGKQYAQTIESDRNGVPVMAWIDVDTTYPDESLRMKISAADNSSGAGYSQSCYDTGLKTLATFKMTEPAEVSEWRTYRNGEYGFEFKYPSDWFVGPNRFDQRGADVALVMCPQVTMVDGDCAHSANARMASTLGPIVFYVNTRNNPPADDSLNRSWKRGELYYEFHLIHISGAEIFDSIADTFNFTN